MRIILLGLLLWLSGCSSSSYLAPGLQDIKKEVAVDWMNECRSYFWWRTRKKFAYRGARTEQLLHPDEWCRRESKTILRDRVPFDYITDITERP